jgi:hypothetical protein
MDVMWLRFSGRFFDVDNAETMIRMMPSRRNIFGMKGYGNER